jgi:hypothetical protein
MTLAAEDQVLEALRLGWDDIYEIGVGLDGFWARWRDGRGETIVDADPGELRRQLQENHTQTPGRA